MCQIAVHLLPRTEPVAFEDATAVVIDVLRASTTIVTALAHGAEQLIPVADVARARTIADELGRRDVLLGGERGGEMIAGFDLGNSPSDYAPKTVQGKRIVFTTSHGTQAIAWASSASEVLIASFVNLASVAHELGQSSGRVHIVCSGTDNYPSIEDSLCAATLVGRLMQLRGHVTPCDDTALMLLALYQAEVCDDASERLRLLMSGRGGQRLTRLGLRRDIADAAQLDRFDIVPRLVKGDPARIVARAD